MTRIENLYCTYSLYNSEVGLDSSENENGENIECSCTNRVTCGREKTGRVLSEFDDTRVNY